ncbi:MAG: helix-turn-helix transcriptional regulator [Clostridia bacterium]|nr:helix-turn-helix transcriptional regulator [Clostridia bacterium]
MTPAFFAGDITITRVASVVSEESKRDMNYFFDRPHHALIYKISGAMVCWWEDKTAEFAENDVVYIPRGMTYRSRMKSDGKYIIINFDTAEEIAPDGIHVAHFENHSNLCSLFTKCADEWLFKDTAHLLNCKSYIYRILALMGRALDGGDADSRKKIQPALDYLRLHINDAGLRPEELAAVCHLGETQFRKLFKRVLLVTPSRYIGSVRIGQAKDLLKSDCFVSVSDVAASVGFSDAETFTRLFRREVGVTPGVYRTLPR